MVWPDKMPFLTLGADMARPSRTGGKKSAAKARNAGPAKGRKTTKTKPRIAPAATRVKRRSVSGPSKDLKEAREQQAATAEILKVIASSPSDVQPVFEAIAARSNQLVGGLSAMVTTIADETLHLRAFTLVSPKADAALKYVFPFPLSEFPWRDAILRGVTFGIKDIEAADPLLPLAVREMARLRGYRSALFVPLMRDGKATGMIGVTRVRPGAFADHHVKLLQTFADQAVIAIENVRLFNETREALERQTATADILKVIASSPSDVQPVFDSLAISALRLCEALSATVLLRDGEVVIPLAHVGPLLAPLGERQPLHRGWVTGRAVLDGNYDTRSRHAGDVRKRVPRRKEHGSEVRASRNPGYTSNQRRTGDWRDPRATSQTHDLSQASRSLYLRRSPIRR